MNLGTFPLYCLCLCCFKLSHVLAHIPTFDPLYSCTLGTDFTLAIHELQRQRGREGQLMVPFMLLLEGPRHRWTVTLSTQHDTEADRVDAETLERDKLS